MVRQACLCVLAAVTLFATASPVAARVHDPEALPEVRIQDLPYGDVLFYYYQGKDFQAATRLLAYDQWQKMPHHEADARLVLAGLYLSLGMYERAARSKRPSRIHTLASSSSFCASSCGDMRSLIRVRSRSASAYCPRA